jgi:hypothetical protein
MSLVRIFLLVLVCCASVTGVTTAQEVSVQEGNETETPEPTDEYVGQVDNTLYVVESGFENGTWYVVVESKLPAGSLVMLSDNTVSVPDGGGFVSVPTKQVRVERGKTKIRFNLESRNGYVGISTSNGAGRIGVGDAGYAFVSGPYSAGDVRNVGIAGVASGVGAVAVLAVLTVRGRKREAERVL